MLDELGHDDDVETLFIEGLVEKIGFGRSKVASMAQKNRAFGQIDSNGVPVFVSCGLQQLAVPAPDVEKSSPLCVTCQRFQELLLPGAVLR